MDATQSTQKQLTASNSVFLAAVKRRFNAKIYTETRRRYQADRSGVSAWNYVAGFFREDLRTVPALLDRLDLDAKDLPTGVAN